MAKAAFNVKNTLFPQYIGLKCKDETRTLLHLECTFKRCWNLGTSESRPEIAGKFLNVVLEEKIIWTDRVRNEVLRITSFTLAAVACEPRVTNQCERNINHAALPTEARGARPNRAIDGCVDHANSLCPMKHLPHECT
jgi:hypothetical protein